MTTLLHPIKHVGDVLKTLPCFILGSYTISLYLQTSRNALAIFFKGLLTIGQFNFASGYLVMAVCFVLG